MKIKTIFHSLALFLLPLVLAVSLVNACSAWGHENIVNDANKHITDILGEVVGNKLDRLYSKEYEDGSYLISFRLYSQNSQQGRAVHLKPGLKQGRDILRAGGADTQTYIENKRNGYWYVEISGCFLDDICNAGEK